jgi:diguanylate cyclase (GGDEF)-like protein/hemerythrin-like metal-binding protein
VGPVDPGPAGDDLVASEASTDAAPLPDMPTDSEAAPFAVIAEGRLSFASPSFRSMFNIGNEISGMGLADLIAAQSRAAVEKLLADPAGPLPTFPVLAVRPEGSSFAVELHLARRKIDGVPTIHVFPRHPPSRQAPESHFSYLAYTDALTGLPNRLLLMDRLRDAILQARTAKCHLAVLMADLDGFKIVNDTFGHQSGDIVLQMTAQRFLEGFRSSDILARFGGDEFCILLPEVGAVREAEAVATRLIEALRQPIAIDGAEFRIGVSVGIALFPDHGLTDDALIAAADAALYAAKKGGRNRYALASAAAASRTLSLPLITWTSAREVGIEILDSPHRQFAERLNDLAASLTRGDELASISENLVILLDHAAHHFATEERPMGQCGYQDAAEHSESHACLLEDLRCFPPACDSRGLSLTMSFLQEWLLRHIEGSDRRLATALKSPGFS